MSVLRDRLSILNRAAEIAVVLGDDLAEVVAAEVTVAATDGRPQTIAIAGIEGLELLAPACTDGDGEHDLDAVDGVSFDQAFEHARLDRAEIDGHERMRDDRQRSLVVDRVDGVHQ